MDNKFIIAGGVGLGLLILLFSGGKKRPTSPAADIANAALHASTVQLETAPAMLGAMSQLHQVQLAAANAHEQNVTDRQLGTKTLNLERELGNKSLDIEYDLNKRGLKLERELGNKRLDIERELNNKSLDNELDGMTLAFLGDMDRNSIAKSSQMYSIAHKSMDNALASTIHKRDDKTKRFSIEKQADVEMARIGAMERMSEPDLGGQLLGFFDNQLGMAQMNAGQFGSQLIQSGNQGMSAIAGMMGGGGGGGGGLLSSAGGGVGGGSSGGGDMMSSIMQILPMVMAFI